MKNQYYIIGCGGFAKEVLFLSTNALDVSWEFKGFIDYKPKKDKINIGNIEHPVIDEDFFLENIKPSNQISIFVGIGDPKILNLISRKFGEFDFPNLIHKNFIGDLSSINMGKGNIITAGCIFTVDISVGSFNVFNLNTTVGHDTEIGSCNVFNPGVNISGSVKIGSENLFGTNSTVLQLVEIKNGNILGALSLANKNIDYNSVMVGVPAKKMEK